MRSRKVIQKDGMGIEAQGFMLRARSIQRFFPAPRGSLAILVAVAALAACGGGGEGDVASSASVDDSSSELRTATTLAVKPATAQQISAALGVIGALDATTAARVLNQATFGATIPSMAALREKGLIGWLNAQFATPVAEKHWNHMLNGRDNAPLSDLLPVFGSNDVMRLRETSTNETWRAYINADDQLRKRMGAALLEIFVINSRVSTIGIGNNQRIAAGFLDMLEKNAFGNFKDLLKSVALSPAMGNYLTHLDNKKAEYGADGVEIRVPDENFARELLQLFSIGLYQLNIDGTLKQVDGAPVETYTQSDIFNLARVFTGFTYNTLRKGAEYLRQPMLANADWHSPEQKAFLGVVIPENTDAMTSLDVAIETIFQHPNVGPFISKQLIQRLVTSNPSPAYVGRVAAMFNNDGRGVRGNMKVVIKAIFNDREAKTAPVVGSAMYNVAGKLREPMVRLTAVSRLMGVSSDRKVFPIGDLSNGAQGLGQSPFKSLSVFNFFRPGYTPPNSAIAAGGYVAPEFQIVAGVAIPSSINVLNTFISQAEQYVSVETSYMEGIASDSAALVDHVNLMLTANTLDPLTRANILTAVEAIPADAPRQRVKATLQLVAASPAFLVETW